MAEAWVSQAERATIIAADRLYLTQVILAQGEDAEVDLLRNRQVISLAVWFWYPKS